MVAMDGIGVEVTIAALAWSPSGTRAALRTLTRADVLSFSVPVAFAVVAFVATPLLFIRREEPAETPAAHSRLAPC